MKTLIAVLCLVSTVAFSQAPSAPRRRDAVPPNLAPNCSAPPQGDTANEALPENYLLTLVVSDKDKVTTELSLVVATADFIVTAGDPRISFSGRIAPDDQGNNILIRYSLGTSVAVQNGNSTEYRDSTAQASVKVRLGEPIQILKSGTQTYKLTISRLPAETHKSK